MARTNSEVASVFLRLADYVEITGDNAFKARAYRNAAATLNALDEPVDRIAREGRLADLPGFGQAIVAKTRDILETGSTAAYDRMREQAPEGVLEFLQLPGIGAKTVRQLWEGLHVDSLESLELAAREGRVRELKGMSVKTEAKIIDALERRKRYRGSVLIDVAADMAEALLAAIRNWPHVNNAYLSGDVRRGAETVSLISLLAVSEDPQATLDAFGAMAQAASLDSRTDRSARVRLGIGIDAELEIAQPDDLGGALVRTTGSAAHVARLAAIAAQTGIGLTGAAEAAVYESVGLRWIEPALREDRGEIEAARENRLPAIIRLEDIRGNLHQHTMASDGKNTIDEMAAAGKAIGYEYIAVTDHSRSLAIANGLTADRLREQIKQVRDAEQTAGIAILAGSEVDILADGTMDFPDDLLAELDIVIASVHSRFSLPKSEMTARVVKAAKNPHVDLIAHPTGRLINAREPFEIDLDAVIEAAKASNTALEINAFPDRLDLNEANAQRAAAAGVRLAIDTDAHHVSQLAMMKYGVGIAQRAWIEPAQVVNAWPYEQLMSWLRRS